MPFDVAISFHHDDTALAVRLADALSEYVRGDVFVSPNRQDELAGTDGDLKFTKIFRDDARVVVILYRSEWGKTRWTSIEESAIRDRRARDLGTNFLVVVNLEPPAVPEWLPEIHQWYALEEYGLPTIIGVIVGKVDAAGGATGPRTPAERARRLLADNEWKKRREELLMAEGGNRYRAALGALQAAIRREVGDLHTELGRELVELEGDEDRLVASCGWAALVVDGKLPTARVVNEPCEVAIRFLEGPIRLMGYRTRPRNEVGVQRLAYAPTREGPWLWHRGTQTTGESDDEVALRLVKAIIELGLGPEPVRRAPRLRGRNWATDW